MGQPLLNGKNNPIPEEPYEETSERYFPLKMDPKDSLTKSLRRTCIPSGMRKPRNGPTSLICKGRIHPW